MHFVIGGAYNGKAQWVRTHYQLDRKSSCLWQSAYEDPLLPKELGKYTSQLIILEGIEYWLKQLLNHSEDNQDRAIEYIEAWKAWSQQDGNKLVVIGTDISKGIVPIEAEDRLWRDVTGRFYQRMVEEANRVHYIWYGIAKTLK